MTYVFIESFNYDDFPEEVESIKQWIVDNYIEDEIDVKEQQKIFKSGDILNMAHFCFKTKECHMAYILTFD